MWASRAYRASRAAWRAWLWAVAPHSHAPTCLLTTRHIATYAQAESFPKRPLGKRFIKAKPRIAVLPGRRSADSGRSKKAATIREVAAHAKVSIATVSRVLNGAASVDETMAARVRAACAALQYQPNPAARTLAGGRSAIVALLVTDVQNPFFMELVRGVEDMLRRHGFLLILCNSAEDRSRERQYIEALYAEHVAGVIIVPTHERQPALQAFIDRGIPVVAVDRRVRHRAIDAILVDNVSAAHEAVTLLITHGYQRIGIITGPIGTTTAQQRLDGYRLALSEAGGAPDARLERRGSFTTESGRQLTAELLALDPPIEALFTANNRMTMGAFEAIHARGLRVPEDIALVGFDDVPWIPPGSISVTTVTQPAYELGSTAALRLIQHLQHPGQKARQEIVLSHDVRVGDSSRARINASAAS